MNALHPPHICRLLPEAQNGTFHRKSIDAPTTICGQSSEAGYIFIDLAMPPLRLRCPVCFTESLL